MTQTIIILCVVIVVLTLIAAAAIYMVVMNNSSRYETHREFEIRQNSKYRKPQSQTPEKAGFDGAEKNGGM